MLSKALEIGVCFHRGPVLGNTERRSSPRAFERRENFLYLGKFLCGILEVCKKKSCKRAVLVIGALLGKLKGFRLLELWRDK